MANQYYISAGLVPIDNASGAASNSYYISAGLIPDDAAAGGETGTVCWGHSTSVEETVTRVLSGNWTGTGTITGSGDSEKIYLLPGQYMESETWNLTSMKAIINLDKYGSGSGGITVKYKDGNSEANCEADTWHAYSIPFACTGWIKIRIEG